MIRPAKRSLMARADTERGFSGMGPASGAAGTRTGMWMLLKHAKHGQQQKRNLYTVMCGDPEGLPCRKRRESPIS